MTNFKEKREELGWGHHKNQGYGYLGVEKGVLIRKGHNGDFQEVTNIPLYFLGIGYEHISYIIKYFVFECFCIL